MKVLRRLVTILMATMIIGLVVLIGLVVMRITAQPLPMALPAHISLPKGASVAAFTVGDGWYGVVTKAGEILIYDQGSGALRQTLVIKP